MCSTIQKSGAVLVLQVIPENLLCIVMTLRKQRLITKKHIATHTNYNSLG